MPRGLTIRRPERVGVADPPTGSRVLDVDQLTVRYGANHAVKGLGLELAQGTTLALLGSNGAGKTSLMRAVTGTLGFHGGTVECGRIELFGREITAADPAVISQAGVALVPEGRRVFKEMTVEENLLSGALSLPHGVSRREVLAETYDHFPVLAERRRQAAVLLSGGEQQIMAIGRAMMSRPRLLLVDEPSLGLAPVMIDRIAEVLAGIRERGTTILLSEQNPSIAMDLADRVVVLRVGSTVLDAAPAEIAGVEQLRDLYLGVEEVEAAEAAPASGDRPEPTPRRPRAGRDEAAIALSVQGVGVKFAGLTALDDVSFEVSEGSVFAVIGPNGAGKSTLFNVISGFYRATSGQVRHGEHVLTSLRPHEISRLGLARTFQNLELSEENTVLENILLGCHLTSRSGVLATALRLPSARREHRELERRAREAAEVVGLVPYLERNCGSLSYGLRKRVEIARGLVGEPRVLLLDEPVAGMTADEIAEMQEVIARAHDELGLTILLIEHDIEFTLRLADEVAVLDFGRMIARGTPDEIRRDPVVHAAYLGSQAASTAAKAQPLDEGIAR